MKHIVRALKLVIPIHPFRMLFYLLLSLPGAVLPAVLLYLQKEIMDNASDLNQVLPLFYYIKPVLLLIGTYMILKLFSLLSKQYMEFGYFSYVVMGLDAKIHEKSGQISLEYYDNAEYYKIIQNAKQSSMFLVFTANLVIMSLIVVLNLLSVSSYLITLHPVLIIFVVFVSAPVILERLISAKYQFGLMQDTVQVARRKKYAFELLSQSDSKKEPAHYGASSYIAQKYLMACKEIDEKEWKHIRQNGKIGVIFAGIKALFHALSIFIMVYLLITKKITIGGFSVLLTSFSVLIDAFVQLFNHAGEVLQLGIMTDSFFVLMDFETKDGIEDKKDNREYAKLEHVFFHYPNTENFALKDISLSVRKGEKIAIVGENGAGKTTLAKLLSGFVLPTKGSMKIGETSREQLKENSVFEQISAVYQEFGHYKLTLAENVYLGDSMKKIDFGKIKDSLEWAGLLFSEQPEHLLLGKEFGGIEISGGQWQRLALARSYYRQRPVIFLDEPTASIDPLEEMEIYKKLDELAEERTVILVTHRLGAVRNVDNIIVLDNGNIVEEGSFEQLIKQKGHFSFLWNEQAKWYQSVKV